MVLTLMAYLIGVLIGVTAVEILLNLPSMGSFITPVYSIELFIKALGIVIFVCVLGRLYPAYRASHPSPTEALRYE